MCGYYGLSISDFWESTFKDIGNFVIGAQKAEADRLRWMRWQTSALLQVHVGKGKKLKPTDLFTLDDEKPGGKKSKVDEEKQRETIEKMDAYMAKKFGGG